jgi:hypothetical protein
MNLEKTTYSVIAVLHGNVEQQEIFDETAALTHAKELVRRGARCVEIYDASDELVWQSEKE